MVTVTKQKHRRGRPPATKSADVPEDDLPALPKPDKHGNYPAIEYSRISLARDLVCERKGLGLSQQQLAELADVRQETISRIESGKHSVTVKTYDKIFQAMEARRRRTLRNKGK